MNEGEGKEINALVNTLSHKFTHTASGRHYQHSYLNRKSRPYTVPYAIGNIAEQIADEKFPSQGAVGAHAARQAWLPQGTTFDDRVVGSLKDLKNNNPTLKLLCGCS